MRKRVCQICAVLFAAMLLLPVYVTAVPPVDGGSEPLRPRVRRANSTRHEVAPAARSVGKINLAPRGLLIMARFANNEFQEENTTKAIDSLANGLNYTYNGATGSIREYFEAQSGGKYCPHFDVVGPVLLPKDLEWYGKNRADSKLDQYTADFVIDAVKEADKEGVDFSLYDNDEDGVIDFVYIIYAGYGEADGGGANTIWPHNWDLESNFYYGYSYQTEYYYDKETGESVLPQFDGKYLNDYACSSERRKGGARTGIGVISHEFSHVLGLPDYYPTSDEATMATNTTPGSWSLMGYGCYLNNSNTPCNFSAFEKYYLGWEKPLVLSDTQNIALPSDGSKLYMVTRDNKEPKDGAMTTDTVYYLESREYKDWDLYLPGHGMLIWQVVYDEQMWLDNTPNDFSTRYKLLTADDSSPYTTDTHGRSKEGVPYPGSTGRKMAKLFGHTIEDITDGAEGVQMKFVSGEVPTGISETTVQRVYKKQIEDGRMVIVRGDEVYDVVGRRVRGRRER